MRNLRSGREKTSSNELDVGIGGGGPTRNRASAEPDFNLEDPIDIQDVHVSDATGGSRAWTPVVLEVQDETEV